MYMSASKEVIINRPLHHYDMKNGEPLARLLGKDQDNPAKKQEVIDAVVQIAAIDKTWGNNMHREVGRTLGIHEDYSKHSFLRQMEEGRIYTGNRFEIRIKKNQSQQVTIPSRR